MKKESPASFLGTPFRKGDGTQCTHYGWYETSAFKAARTPFPLYKGGVRHRRTGDFVTEFQTRTTMKFIPYNTELKEFSRQLRINSTLGEVMLWKMLRGAQMMGYTFNRQKPLGNYIVDFYCKSLNLVIEIDGGSHHFDEVIVKDGIRQEVLEGMGLHLLRFTEQRVRFELPYVVLDIQRHIEALKEEGE